MVLSCISVLIYSIEVKEVCLHISNEQQIEITSCANPVFYNFGGAFVNPKTVKNNIAGMIINLKSVMR